jgi:hypothetical protein
MPCSCPGAAATALLRLNDSRLASNGDVMLPDLRLLIGATLATAFLGLFALGLATTAWLSHHAKVHPLQSSRTLAYAEQTDWQPLRDPELTRTFDMMALTATRGGAVARMRAQVSALAPARALALRHSAIAQREAAVMPAQAVAEAPWAETLSIEQPVPPPAQPERLAVIADKLKTTLPEGSPVDNLLTARQTASRVEEPAVTLDEGLDYDATMPTRAVAPPTPQVPAAMMPADQRAMARVADAPVATLPLDAPPAATPTAEASVVPSETASDEEAVKDVSHALAEPSVGQVVAVATVTSPNAAEKAVDQRREVLPKAVPTKVSLPRPRPKMPRATRARAAKTLKARRPRARIAQPKPKAKAAPTAGASPFGGQQAATGYRMGHQRPTSWGWDFPK